MTMPAFEYVRPASLEAACAFLETHGSDAMILAGGTDLLVSLKQRVFTPKYVVDLKRLPELGRLAFSEKEGLKIGASTKLLDLSENGAARARYTAVSEAAHSVAAVAQQGMGTVGGNLCLDTRCWYFNQSEMWRGTLGACFKLEGDACFVVKGVTECYANYSGDTAPAFIVLGAEVKIAGPGGVRTAPVDDLFTGDGKVPISLKPGEVLVEVNLPAPAPGTGSAYRKYRLRDRVDFPLAGAAAAVRLDEGQVCVDAKVALTAVGCAPERSPKVEEVLLGAALTEEVIARAARAARAQARPLKTTVMPPPHRKKMLELIVRDAIRDAASRCGLESPALESMETPS
ncbi:MAG: xanthine dehydrogenase family protein subunit M [Nitrospinota bacterium]|nr:xanthine dehydrogenase family protein subunit M [Nitrospinota bacterium]